MLSVETIRERLQYYDCIRLTGVSAQGYHGVFASEKASGQTFVVDADLYVDTTRAGASDNLADTVDYGQASQVIVDVISGEAVDLLEHLVARLAQALRELPGVRAVRVCLHKPQAPLLVDFEDVSLTIWRGLEDIENPDSDEFVSEIERAPAAPAKVVLALGGNLGPVVKTFRQVIAALDCHSQIEVDKISPLLRTQAVLAQGQSPQPEYYNAVVIVHTSLAPLELLQLTQSLEQEFGRVREHIWGARTIDIDIIDYYRVRSQEPELTLPHPRAHERAFVLLPWSLIEAGAKLPGHGEIVLLAERAPDRDGVREIYSEWYREVAALPASGTGEIPLPRWSRSLSATPVIIDEGAGNADTLNVDAVNAETPDAAHLESADALNPDKATFTSEQDSSTATDAEPEVDPELIADYQDFLSRLAGQSPAVLKEAALTDAALPAAESADLNRSGERESEEESTVQETASGEGTDLVELYGLAEAATAEVALLENVTENHSLEAADLPEAYAAAEVGRPALKVTETEQTETEQTETERMVAPASLTEADYASAAEREEAEVSLWQKLKRYFSFKNPQSSVADGADNFTAACATVNLSDAARLSTETAAQLPDVPANSAASSARGQNWEAALNAKTGSGKYFPEEVLSEPEIQKPKWTSLYAVEENQERNFQIANTLAECEPQWSPISEHTPAAQLPESEPVLSPVGLEAASVTENARLSPDEFAPVSETQNSNLGEKLNPGDILNLGENLNLGESTTPRTNPDGQSEDLTEREEPCAAPVAAVPDSLALSRRDLKSDKSGGYPSRKHKGQRAITGEIPVVTEVSPPTQMDLSAVDLNNIQKKVAAQLEKRYSDTETQRRTPTRRRSIMRPCTTGSIPVVKALPDNSAVPARETGETREDASETAEFAAKFMQKVAREYADEDSAKATVDSRGNSSAKLIADNAGNSSAKSSVVSEDKTADESDPGSTEAKIFAELYGLDEEGAAPEN